MEAEEFYTMEQLDTSKRTCSDLALGQIFGVLFDEGSQTSRLFLQPFSVVKISVQSCVLKMVCYSPNPTEHDPLGTRIFRGSRTQKGHALTPACALVTGNMEHMKTHGGGSGKAHRE